MLGLTDGEEHNRLGSEGILIEPLLWVLGVVCAILIAGGAYGMLKATFMPLKPELPPAPVAVPVPAPVPIPEPLAVAGEPLLLVLTCTEVHTTTNNSKKQTSYHFHSRSRDCDCSFLVLYRVEEDLFKVGIKYEMRVK